ncbi:MAG: glycosyltransferase family 9 protein [Chloroflexota bacterium]|nr:glycosyltransferase family 9 protein [Chloroflexota bacterium]
MTPNRKPEAVTLIMQPDHLGDILLSQPAVTLLRERLPNERLVAVVGPWSSEIVHLAWPVDEVVELAYPGFSRTARGAPWEPYQLLSAERDRLLPLRAIRAIVLRPDAWWAAWLARMIAPEVVGSDDARVASFATSTVAVSSDAHASIRTYQIAAGAVGLDNESTSWSARPLGVPSSDSEGTAEALLCRCGITKPFAVIHPGSGATVKEWPEHRWRALVASLVAGGLPVIATGSHAEREMVERIVTGIAGASSVAGKTDLRTLAALMGRASIVLGCDSGPMHLAVATGTPTVHLFGPSDPVRYGPWGDPRRHRVIRAGWSCPRCGDLSPDRPRGCGCMLAIQPKQVIAVTMELLDASQP